MSLETYLVDIQDVSSSQLRSNFSEKDLKNMAELILELGGLIQPLIIKEGGLRRFEVIEGHFEYYAVVKAQEIDDNLEMVRAFIINENAENSAKKQLQFLNAREPINPIVDPGKPPSISISNNEWEAKMLSMESRQNNLEIRLGELIEHQKQDFKRLTDTLQEIKHGLQQLEITANFDKLTQQLVEKLTISPIPPSPSPSPVHKLNLKNSNPKQIETELKNVGVTKPQIKAALKAISYWKENEGGLSWDNLESSTQKSTDKIEGFGKKTYKKLEQIGEISNT